MRQINVAIIVICRNQGGINLFYKDIEIPEGSVDLAKAAYLLSHSASYARWLVKHKRLPAIKMGRKWVVKLSDIEEYKLNRTR